MPSAIITGGSQGIGKATAFLFARKGYDLVLTAREPETLEATAAEVRAIGTKVLAVPCDVKLLCIFNAQQQGWRLKAEG